ncbi:uncharacterized protein M421DRAFT_343629 [Didymella exigua CBS 183.55]|uniref:Uncharacterized protein n=1 Tax=Didymella exigua CBS 183.55 TaxID=1150837 RepID=A0A6A5RUX6_9PLEO|nr:uncharacterized protein M421DRAFT_343629 [Didymella exigua CBS 183.55]KAF1931303.1 hypothetical protein M421DRAFT_343629 [Didymella exigua CBS 183.55]
MHKCKSRKAINPQKKKTEQENLRAIYEPLPQTGYIRVLVLQPGDDKDDVVCRLEVRLMNHPGDARRSRTAGAILRMPSTYDAMIRWYSSRETLQTHLDIFEVREKPRQDFTLSLACNHFSLFFITDNCHHSYIQAYRRVMLALLNKKDVFSEDIVTERHLRHATRVADFLNDGTFHKCLFLTRVGHVGLIIMEASVTFLLTPGNGGRYRLVEGCYIHGVLHPWCDG